MQLQTLSMTCDTHSTPKRQSLLSSERSSYGSFTGGEAVHVSLQHHYATSNTDFLSLKDNASDLLTACKKDIGKGAFEAGFELDWCANDCIFVCNKIEQWAKDEKAPDIPLSNALLKPKIRKEPFGLVLIIGYL